MTTSSPENAAREVVDNTHTNDDGDTKEASLLLESEKGKGKEKLTSSEDDSVAGEGGTSDDASGSGTTTTPEGNEDTTATGSAQQEPQPWQAVFAPQYNAYYFYNNQTGETTWTNPLQPSADSASSATSAAAAASTIPPSPIGQGVYSDPDTSETPSSSTSTPAPYNALQAAALAQGIDPSLAHLDPALVTATTSASGGPIPTFQAKFNARTGAFTKPDARTPGHLSEYERMKRMSQFYFDVNAWEQQIADDKEEEEDGNGKKRKRPTKKDLVCRFVLTILNFVILVLTLSLNIRNGSKNKRNRRRLQKRHGCGHSASFPSSLFCLCVKRGGRVFATFS